MTSGSTRRGISRGFHCARVGDVAVDHPQARHWQPTFRCAGPLLTAGLHGSAGAIHSRQRPWSQQRPEPPLIRAPYTAVSTYYNDFVAGNYDVCIGSRDTFAARYPGRRSHQISLHHHRRQHDRAAGAEVQRVADVANLKGKAHRCAASTGTYRMVRALIKEAFDFDIEKDATIQNGRATPLPR